MNLKNKTNLEFAERWFRQWTQDCEYGFKNLFIEMKFTRSMHPVTGYCKYPRGGGHAYTVRAAINESVEYPFTFEQAIGTKKPPSNYYDEACADAGFAFGQNFIWLYDKELIENSDELMVWILGHGIWHFLCHTKQAKGNYQTKANAFGFKLLRAFKKTSEIENDLKVELSDLAYKPNNAKNQKKAKKKIKEVLKRGFKNLETMGTPYNKLKKDGGQ